jgi:hypothetical protein
MQSTPHGVPLFCSLYEEECDEAKRQFLQYYTHSILYAFQATIRLYVIRYCTAVHLLARHRKHIFQLLLRSAAYSSKLYFGINSKQKEEGSFANFNTTGLLTEKKTGIAISTVEFRVQSAILKCPKGQTEKIIRPLTVTQKKVKVCGVS